MASFCSLLGQELMDKLKSERGKRDRVQHDNDLKNEHLKKLQKKLERLIRDQTAELEAEEFKTQQMSGAKPNQLLSPLRKNSNP